MMKRIIALLIIMLFCFSGCNNEKEEANNIAVLTNKSTESLIIFSDKSNKEITKITVPSLLKYFYCDDEFFYYSSDNKNYNSINYHDYSKGKDITNAQGVILFLNENDFISYCDSKYLCLCKNSQIEHFEIKVNSYLATDDYFYCLDLDNNLHIFSLDDFSFLKSIKLEDSYFGKLTVISNMLFVGQDNGLTLINNNERDATYLYPENLDVIDNLIGNHIYGWDNKEQVVYRLSIEKYKLSMELELDDIYYREIVFSEIFSQYYKKGYSVINYLEMGRE